MLAAIFIGLPEIIEAIVLLLIIGVLVDIMKGGKKDTVEKIVWTAIVVLFSGVGVIIYLSVGRKEKFLYHVVNKFTSAKE